MVFMRSADAPYPTVLALLETFPAKGLHLGKVRTCVRLRKSKAAVLAGYVHNPGIVVESDPAMHVLRNDAAHRFLQFSVSFAEAQVARRARRMPASHKRFDIPEPDRVLLEELGQSDGNHVAHNDLLVRHVQTRRVDSAGDHPADGILVMIEVVWIAAAVGQYQPGGVSPARAPGTLSIVERLRWNVAEKNRVQVAKIDADFERAGRAEKVDGAALERILPSARFPCSVNTLCPRYPRRHRLVRQIPVPRRSRDESVAHRHPPVRRPRPTRRARLLRKQKQADFRHPDAMEGSCVRVERDRMGTQVEMHRLAALPLVDHQKAHLVCPSRQGE